MGALEELASFADVEGLDWAHLNAVGAGIMGDGGYLDELERRWDKFYAVAETLAITDAEWEETSAKEASDAWKEVRDHIKAKAGKMLDALSSGELTVAWEQAATIYSGSLKKLVIATSAVSHRNLTAHEDGTLVFAIQTGQTTVDAAQTDADHVAMLWSGLVKLDQWNALSELKKKQYAGVGAGEAAEAAAGAAARGLPIVIAAIGIAAVIAAIIVFLAYLSHRNELIDKYCFDKSGNTRPDAPYWCQQVGEQLTTDPLAVFLQPLEKTGQRLATGVTLAVGVALVVWVAPSAIRRMGGK